MTLLRERGGEVKRRRRLGHAALLVGERDDLGLSFHGGSDARLLESRPLGIRMAGWRFLHGNYDRGDDRQRSTRSRARRELCGAACRASACCVCVGAGGVGKTTTSAALALGLAARGQKVAVVTIDPAKRLAVRARAAASSPASPAASTRSCSPQQGVEMKGELWAMMLDAKRTFDEIDDAPGARQQAREEILANPDLPRALHGGRGLPGAQRDRQAVRALRGARLRRDRARHAAVAQRAGLPGRPEPAAGLPRRARAAGVPRARRPDRAPVRSRHRSGVRDLRARHRRGHAQPSCRASSVRCRA